MVRMDRRSYCDGGMMKLVRLVSDKTGELPKYLIGRVAEVLGRDKSQDDYPHKAYKVRFVGQKRTRILWDDEFVKVS